VPAAVSTRNRLYCAGWFARSNGASLQAKRGEKTWKFGTGWQFCYRGIIVNSMFEKLLVEIPCLNARARSLWCLYHPFRKEHLGHQCQNNSHTTRIHLPQRLLYTPKDSSTTSFLPDLFTGELLHQETFTPAAFCRRNLLHCQPFTQTQTLHWIQKYTSIYPLLLSIGYYIIEYWEDH